MCAKRLMTCGRRSGPRRAWAQGPAGPVRTVVRGPDGKFRRVMRHETDDARYLSSIVLGAPASSRLGTKAIGRRPVLNRRRGGPPCPPSLPAATRPALPAAGKPAAGAQRVVNEILVAVGETKIEGGSDGNS